MDADHDRRHVLFVDGEPSMHRLVERSLLGTDIRLTCAGGGAQALQTLEQGRVDLLVTALSMPVVDGVDLLRHVANRGLMIPVIVATSRDPLPPVSRSPLRFLREPLQPATLAALVREQLAAAPACAVALAELAQLLALDRRSCTLRAQANGVEGELLFNNGALIDATVGGLTGEPAARVLLSWRRAALRVEPLVRSRRPTITADLSSLLPTLLVADPPANPLPTVAPTLAAPPTPAPQIDPVPVAPASSVPAWERPAAHVRISALLAEALQIDGAIGAGLAEWELDHCLAVRTATPALAPDHMRTTLSGHARMMRAVMMTMLRLRRSAAVQDVLIMLDQQMHVLSPLPHHDGLFLDLVLDRTRGSLALARIRLAALLAKFDLDAEPPPPTAP